MNRYRVYYQHGTIDEGVLEIGEVIADTKREAISIAVCEKFPTEPDRTYFLQFAQADIIKPQANV
jgi:hypothetical protein